MKQKCLNCHHIMYGPICSSCGQKQALPIKANRVIKDIWSQLLELDFKFVRALRDIIIRPGVMINGFLAGKRISYTNPIKLLFFVATAYFFVLQYFDIKVDIFSKNEKDMGRAMAALLNYLIFIILMPTAFFYRLIFSKSKLNLAEAYVSLAYIWSGYLIISISVAILSFAFTQYYIPVKHFFGLIYLVYASKQITKNKLHSSVGKAILISLCYYISTIIVMSIILLISNLLQYEPLMVDFKNLR